MREITFATANNPNKFIGGDARLTRLIISACAEIAQIKIVTLDECDDYSISGITSVKKSRINLSQLLFSALKSGTHPIFVRYNSKTLRRVLLENQSDFYIGEHLYMSNEIIASGIDKSRIISNVHILESGIQSGLSSVFSKVLFKQECGVISKSHAALSFDPNEIRRLEQVDALQATQLKLLTVILPSKNMSTLDGRALFVGNQKWEPNREAVKKILELWPKIRKISQHAEIDIVGPLPDRPYGNIPKGVHLRGAVEHLDRYLMNARFLFAPISTGGGVRVKILEATSYGIPIVTTAAGVGHLSNIFPDIDVCQDDEDLIANVIKCFSNFSILRQKSKSIFDRNVVASIEYSIPAQFEGIFR
jgi:glycosyltransferase involved in cell wall biosynthesis